MSTTPLPAPQVAIAALQPGAQPRLDPYQFNHPTPVEQTIEPAHQVAFPGAQYIFSVAFSTDGRTAYCQVNGTGIDLWSAGASRWPAILGGCVGAVLLIYLLVAMRVRKRRQVPGDPHCRHCNYHLISHAPHAVKKGADRVPPSPGTRCPECGAALDRKRPVRGRTTLHRLCPSTALVLLCVGAYAWLFLAGFPRSANAPEAPQIWSRWVDKYAENHQIDWLLKHRKTVTRIMTVDTGTGEVTGCMRTARSWTGEGYGIVASPDGRHLAAADTYNRLCWVDVRTGWTVASTFGGEFLTGPGHESFVLAVEGPDDDPRVYYRAVDRKSAMSRFLEWRPKSGTKRILLEEPAYIFTYSNATKAAQTRGYALIHRPDGLVVVSAPDFSQAYDEQTYVVTVRSPVTSSSVVGGIERQILIPGGRFPCSSPLIVSTDGSRLFVASFPDIMGYDANTGEESGTLKLAVPESPNGDRLCLSPSGGRLFVPVHPNAILVRDVARMAWAARLTVPPQFIAPTLWASRDDRWLAATPFRSTGNQKEPYITELFLYDLAPLGRTKK